jgi:hypothetical protein
MSWDARPDKPLDELIGEPANFDVPAPEQFLLEHMTVLSIADYRQMGAEVMYRDTPGAEPNGFTKQKVGESLNILAEKARIGRIIALYGMEGVTEKERAKHGDGSGIFFVREPQQIGFGWTPLLGTSTKAKAACPIEYLVVEPLEEMVAEIHDIRSSVVIPESRGSQRSQRLHKIQAQLGKAISPTTVKIWTGIIQMNRGGSNIVEPLDM